MTKDEMQAEITRLQYEVDAIPSIKAERDALALGVDQWRVDYHELRLECDALAADAGRYRWVKKQTRAFSLDMGGHHSWTVTGGFSRAKGPSLDEAIDAAIQAGVQ